MWKNARTGPDGKNYLVDYYNFYVVIAVGYRVKSPNTIVFRKWATNVLKEYALPFKTSSNARHQCHFLTTGIKSSFSFN